MPAIKKTGAADEYRALRADSATFNENNDCTVVAIAAVTGVPYAVAHAALAAEGRKNGRGCFKPQQRAALEKLGFKLIRLPVESVLHSYPHPYNQLKNVTTHHPERVKGFWADGAKYLFYTRGHVAAIINGVNVDWTKGRAKRVLEIYRVVEA